MKNKLTYREAFDLITEAYIKGEIKPFDCGFCFCGNLAGNTDWKYDGDKKYTLQQYARMERALFSPFPTVTVTDVALVNEAKGTNVRNSPEFEDLLFQGMCNALEVLQQIHKERGDITAMDSPVFVKRELAMHNEI